MTDARDMREWLRAAQNASHFALSSVDDTQEALPKDSLSHQHYVDPKICYLRHPIPDKNASVVNLEGVSKLDYSTEQGDRFRYFQVPPADRIPAPKSQVVFGIDKASYLESAAQRQQRELASAKEEGQGTQLPAGRAPEVMTAGLRDTLYTRHIGPSTHPAEFDKEHRAQQSHLLHGGEALAHTFESFDRRKVGLDNGGPREAVDMHSTDTYDPILGVSKQF